MIKLKITKDKLKSVIQIVGLITTQLRKDKPNLKEWPLAHTNVHLHVLDKISRKMRSKLVMLEDKPGNQVITYSIDEIHALVIVVNVKIDKDSQWREWDPYSKAVFQEISTVIFQKLLS